MACLRRLYRHLCDARGRDFLDQDRFGSVAQRALERAFPGTTVRAARSIGDAGLPPASNWAQQPRLDRVDSGPHPLEVFQHRIQGGASPGPGRPDDQNESIGCADCAADRLQVFGRISGLIECPRCRVQHGLPRVPARRRSCHAVRVALQRPARASGFGRCDKYSLGDTQASAVRLAVPGLANRTDPAGIIHRRSDLGRGRRQKEHRSADHRSPLRRRAGKGLECTDRGDRRRRQQRKARHPHGFTRPAADRARPYSIQVRERPKSLCSERRSGYTPRPPTWNQRASRRLSSKESPG